MLETKKSAKTGLMGGAFDPFHLAHLNSLLTVREKFSLNTLLLIPSFKTPLKRERESASPLHRLEMLKALARPYPFIETEPQEIQRKGLSYSQATVDRLFQTRPGEELFFIIGLDQFFLLPQWKNWQSLLKKSHFIAVARPGWRFPSSREECPQSLRPFVQDMGPKGISFSFTSRKIHFCPLKGKNISSSDIRQRLKKGLPVEGLIPKPLIIYIKKHRLYTPHKTGESAPTQQKSRNKDSPCVDPERNTQNLLALSIGELEKKKAFHIQSFDLRRMALPFSFGLTASALNTRQSRQLARHIKHKIKKHFGLLPLAEEGLKESQWIALDYGELVIHIFYDHTRKIYGLDELWESRSARILE